MDTKWVAFGMHKSPVKEYDMHVQDTVWYSFESEIISEIDIKSSVVFSALQDAHLKATALKSVLAHLKAQLCSIGVKS